MTAGTRLTPDQRKWLQEEVDKRARRKLRIPHPGQPRPFCAAMTANLTKCKHWARNGSLYCYKHGR